MVVLAADTNVWARAYLNDDPVQAGKSRSALAEARSAGGVFVPLLVLAELSWVLRGRWDRERVLSAIEGLLQTRGVVVESPALAWRALEASRKGAIGFSDHLIREIAVESGANEVITFDKAFGRLPGVRRLR
jgi:predicted nucleic-acid-binding protein